MNETINSKPLDIAIFKLCASVSEGTTLYHKIVIELKQHTTPHFVTKMLYGNVTPTSEQLSIIYNILKAYDQHDLIKMEDLI